MASLDVIAPALLLPISFLSLALSLYNCVLHRSTPVKTAVLLFLATVAAASGGTALSVACGEPLRVVAKVFINLLHAALSAVSVYALGPSSQTHAFPLPFLGFFLSLAVLLVACELVSALIPTSPLLLPALLALVSRGILLVLAIATAVLLRRRYATVSSEIDVEGSCTPNKSSEKVPGRVPSPSQAAWPFPGSLASQDQPKRTSCTANRATFPNPPSSTLTCEHDVVNNNTHKMDRQNFIFLPLTLAIAQMFAIISAALSVTTSILVDATTSQTAQPQGHILLASATCTLLWSFMILVTIQLLPDAYSERRVATGREEDAGNHDGFTRGNPITRKPKPSLSRRESDALLDFLSLRDPFASSPPPPPPLPPAGLGLDEVDVGWNGNREIGTQYRFPAPRSIVKGGRRKGKMACINGKKRLVHQASARTLLPVPETRGTEIDAAGDREFGDEAWLAQLLLQSLSADEDYDSPSTPSVPTVQPPQVAHVQQISRWSTSTTVQSVMSASISNRSGVSTYTTCASEKIPTSRISMSTIASALGGRKSSETRRKSAMTASSSKG